MIDENTEVFYLKKLKMSSDYIDQSKIDLKFHFFYDKYILFYIRKIILRQNNVNLLTKLY